MHSRSLSLLLLLTSSLSFAAGVNAQEQKDPYYFLKVVDLPHPYCEGKLDLDVAEEFFVEIANDLAGRNEYNEMVRMLHRRHWKLLDSKWTEFKDRYSDSPLIEAGSFLYVQSLFDRIEHDDGSKSRDAERSWRDLQIAYPKSTLAPVLWATVSAFFLRTGNLQRALATYQDAEERFPNDGLQCVFSIGIGETCFLLRDWAPASKRFRQVSEKCGNIRLKTAAMVRLADSEWLRGLPGVQSLYEKVLEEEGSVVERFFPFTLYNLGEIKYREGAYLQARYYFDQYTKVESKVAKCVPHALKRLADISFRIDNNWERSTGMYLAVRESSPYSDVGRFSYIHGLLIGLPSFAPIEYQRRLKVIDAEIDNIKEESLRWLAYLEKGLALLDAGEKSAVDYLVRLNERAHFQLKSGVLGTFVRDRLLKIIQGEVEQVLKQASSEGLVNDAELFGPIEAAYGVWLKGTDREASARNFYNKIVLHRFEELMEEDDWQAAIATLERWQSKELWDPKGPDWEVRRIVGESFADLLFDFEGEQTEHPAYLMRKSQKVLAPFFRPEFQLLWMEVAQATGDTLALRKLADAQKGTRTVASIDSRLPEEIRSRMLLASGEALLTLKRYREAEIALIQSTDPLLRERTLEKLLELHLKTRNYTKAFSEGKELLGKYKGQRRLAHLDVLLDIVAQGKLWKQAPDVLAWAKEASLSGKSLSPFYFLTGKAGFELGQWKQAVESYEAGLKEDPEAAQNGEARFNLGKSLAKMRRTAQAKEILKELSEKKDPFWSSLARNEFKGLK